MALLVFPSKGFFFLLCMARKDRTVDYPVLCTVLYLLTPNPPAGSCFIYPMAEKKNSCRNSDGGAGGLERFMLS